MSEPMDKLRERFLHPEFQREVAARWWNEEAPDRPYAYLSEDTQQLYLERVRRVLGLAVLMSRDEAALGQQTPAVVWIAIADGEGADARLIYDAEPHQAMHDFMCVCGKPWKGCETDGIREDIGKIDDRDEWNLDEEGAQFSINWRHETGCVSLYRMRSQPDSPPTPREGLFLCRYRTSEGECGEPILLDRESLSGFRHASGENWLHWAAPMVYGPQDSQAAFVKVSSVSADDCSKNPTTTT